MRWLSAYVRANVQAALEYRTSFASEVLAMIVNDAMWVTFWVAFYDRYPAVHGWQRGDVITLWAVIATGFGLTNALCGNTMRLAGMIARGELDFYLTLPRPVLLHALVSRMSISALGDVVFGPAVFAWFARPSLQDCALFAVLSVASAAIFLGFAVAFGSFGFWLGNADGLAQLATNALLGLATYPSTVFRGGLKLALFSVLPAALLGFVPVEVLRLHRWDWLAAELAFAGFMLWLGGAVFARGLRRYESGSLMMARL